MFENAKWIWKAKEPCKDEYVLFSFSLDYAHGDALMRLSADSDYNVFINGKLCAFGQYHDYEENAVYEEIPLQDSLQVGNNEIQILVWYYGQPNFSYSVGKAGLLFEVLLNGKQAVKSDERIVSAYEPHYKRGLCKEITSQLGYSYEYDANNGEPSFSQSVAVDKPFPKRVRPVKKLLLGDGVQGKLQKMDGTKTYLFDFEKERVGFLHFCIDSETECTIRIAYGEFLLNGEISSVIGGRDFSFVYHAKKGKNDFCNAFRRLGCRYVALESDAPIRIESVELLPTDYPLTELPYQAGNPLRQAIYDTSIYTLKMCMHDHFEDCPWREQSLWTMDSRNQMLCVYYAFGEYAYVKESLALFANARTCGGLLPMCAPCDCDKTIPSFGLHYFTQVREYLEYSQDTAFVSSIYDTLCSLLQAYEKRVCDGLLLEFEGDAYWNFYEWKPHLAGDYKYNLILNALYLQALQNMSKIAQILQKQDDFLDRAERLKGAIYDYFYDSALQLFVVAKEKVVVSELGNYLCILTGVVTGDKAKALIETLRAYDERITLTLSMRCFEYDALLAVDKNAYTQEILEDIDRRWKRMLDDGATTFWETEDGYKAFDGAGSLCHGWSAIPVYYYHTLLGKKE